MLCDQFSEPHSLVEFAQQDQAAVRRDAGTLEIDLQASNKRELKRLALCRTQWGRASGASSSRSHPHKYYIDDGDDPKIRKSSSKWKCGLIAAAKWLAHTSKQTQLRLEATGIRSQVLALVAAALEPRLFSEVAITGGMHSLGFLLDTPVEPRLAPELFCLDLYKDFDLDQFRAMAAPTKVSETEFAKPADLPDEPPNED